MDKQTHPNYIKSSSLIFGTVGLGLINFVFASELLSSGQNIVTAILTLVIIAGLGFLIRQGKNWVKYVLGVFMVFGLIGIPLIINNMVQRPVVGIINIAQTTMQLWATVLLFKVPKIVDDKINNK